MLSRRRGNTRAARILWRDRETGVASSTCSWRAIWQFHYASIFRKGLCENKTVDVLSEQWNSCIRKRRSPNFTTQLRMSTHLEWFGSWSLLLQSLTMTSWTHFQGWQTLKWIMMNFMKSSGYASASWMRTSISTSWPWRKRTILPHFKGPQEQEGDWAHDSWKQAAYSWDWQQWFDSLCCSMAEYAQQGFATEDCWQSPKCD